VSFTSHHLQLGSKQPVHQLQLCNKCEEKRPPEGGIQMSAAKWICACCWTKRVTTRNLLQHAKTKTPRATDRKTSEDV
jgi:hypothetical protein